MRIKPVRIARGQKVFSCLSSGNSVSPFKCCAGARAERVFRPGRWRRRRGLVASSRSGGFYFFAADGGVGHTPFYFLRRRRFFLQFLTGRVWLSAARRCFDCGSVDLAAFGGETARTTRTVAFFGWYGCWFFFITAIPVLALNSLRWKSYGGICRRNVNFPAGVDNFVKRACQQACGGVLLVLMEA